MAFNPKLIPLFDGSDSRQSVIKWIEKAELICLISSVKHTDCVVPMHLLGDAYAVYQQLSEEKKSHFNCIKNTSYKVFTKDSITAWRQLLACRLYSGEDCQCLFD